MVKCPPNRGSKGHELNHLEIALSKIQDDDMKIIVSFIVDLMTLVNCVNLQFVSGRVLLYYVIIVYLRIIRKRIETYSPIFTSQTFLHFGGLIWGGNLFESFYSSSTMQTLPRAFLVHPR